MQETLEKYHFHLTKVRPLKGLQQTFNLFQQKTIASPPYIYRKGSFQPKSPYLLFSTFSKSKRRIVRILHFRNYTRYFMNFKSSRINGKKISSKVVENQRQSYRV